MGWHREENEMGSLIGYQLADSLATITMDDGKVNVLSPRMIAELGRALDQAQEEAATVILAGRDGVFSAGFDLPVIRAGGPAATSMLRAGFDLAERVLSYPRPVVIACTGHAVAMGAFLLLSGDYRVGVAGPYKITANEVAIGLTLPRAAVEICRQRLTPAHFNRATVLAEAFQPDGAVEAGFLDQACAPADFWEAVRGIAGKLAGLDLDAHKATKLRVRKAALTAVHDAIAADSADLARRDLATAAAGTPTA
jgi:enoyl-CoA hydratase